MLGLNKKVLCALMIVLGCMGTKAEYNPDKWLMSPVDSVWQYSEFCTQPIPEDDRWWRGFNDDVMNRLIILAMHNNYDAKAAYHRIQSAQAQKNALYSGYMPQIGLSLGYIRNQDAGLEHNDGRNNDLSSYFNAGLSASWEIDIFGRIAAKVKAGKANVGVARLEYDALMVSLAANVASDYVSFRMYQQLLLTNRSHLKSQADILEITQARYDAGLVSKLDVAQATTLLYTIEASIPDIEAKQAIALNSIATLCGVPESEIAIMIGSMGALPHVPDSRNAGLPIDLIRRRPDVVEAEVQLAGVAAQLGIAKKDFLPTLSIQASVAVHSADIKGLFTNKSLDYNLSPSLNWTLFDGLARERGVIAAKENLEAYIADYNMIVTKAVAEVNNAMSNYLAAQKRKELLTKVVSQSAETVGLALTRYKLGLTDFSDVASAQVSYLNSENSLVSAQGAALSAYIDLYEALGGGWTLDPNFHKK